MHKYIWTSEQAYEVELIPLKICHEMLGVVLKYLNQEY